MGIVPAIAHFYSLPSDARHALSADGIEIAAFRVCHCDRRPAPMFISEKLPLRGIFSALHNKDWYSYCSPEGFYQRARAPIPWLAIAALLFCATALYLAFSVAPVDVRQREIARIAFIHVPASWVAMLIFLATAASAGVGWALKARLAAMAAQALAPTGLMFAFLGLWTGCLWRKAIWGTWWVWDWQTYSDLILACLYIGVIGLHGAVEDLHRANKWGALLLFAGVLSIPAHIAAEQSWNAQLPGMLPIATGAIEPGIEESASLLAMSLGFLLYTGVVGLLRLRCIILENERLSHWVARRGDRVP